MLQFSFSFSFLLIYLIDFPWDENAGNARRAISKDGELAADSDADEDKVCPRAAADGDH